MNNFTTFNVAIETDRPPSQEEKQFIKEQIDHALDKALVFWEPELIDWEVRVAETETPKE